MTMQNEDDGRRFFRGTRYSTEKMMVSNNRRAFLLNVIELLINVRLEKNPIVSLYWHCR